MAFTHRTAIYIALFLATPYALAAQETPKEPVATPALNPEEAEAKRLADEAEQKQRKEAEAKALAERQAREEAERKKAEEESLWANSKIYTGLTGGLGIGLNSIHGAGFTFGMAMDYIAFK